MHSRVADGLAIHGCGRCGGVWLGNDACARLTAGELPSQMPPLAQAVHEFAYNMQQRGVGSFRDAPRRAPEGPRRCPTCRRPLSATPVFKTEVEVDICAEHGTYFDPTELGALNHHYLLKKSRDEAGAADFARLVAETKPYSHSEVVLSLWGIPILWKEKDTAWDL